MSARTAHPAPPGADQASAASLSSIVRQLCEHDEGLTRQERNVAYSALPSRDALARVVDELRSVLFPGYFGGRAIANAETMAFHAGATLDRAMATLEDQVRRAQCLGCEERDPTRCAACEEKARTASAQFLSRLPEVKRLLATDVRAAYEGDPAATSPAETILCYPGIVALTCQRLAHELYVLGVPLLPRIITEHAHSLTGIDIHPGARIGESFFIDHGTGVVVGETSEIGRRVRLYQGVTLGARSFALDEHGHPVKGIPRHPIVEDDVIIYSGATVLGRITVGAGSVIGGNVWLTHSVPAGSRVSQTGTRQTHYSEGEGI
jgi:serine O-acetyltransferase